VTEREDFFANLRRALGRESDAQEGPAPDPATLVPDQDGVGGRARAIRERIEAEAEPLLLRLAESAERAGWGVARFGSLDAAREHVTGIARNIEASLIVRSSHPALAQTSLDQWFSPLGMELMAPGDGSSESSDSTRALASRADIGITGVDYAIAETGTCVLIPRSGVSRLVSLLPPVYIAVVQRGQVLPSLDELFALRRQDYLDGSLRSYMSLITGPSRSADIESTLVTGMHGPGEVHMVLVG